jgi:hypothetical protein
MTADQGACQNVEIGKFLATAALLREVLRAARSQRITIDRRTTRRPRRQ